MIRDFTDETKERLLDQIDKINKENQSELTDAIGDALLYIGKWTGILSLNEDMSNVESYQKQVLDRTDMKKKDLKKIFNNVEGVDRETEKIFSEVQSKETLYLSKLDILIGMINPNFNISSADAIKSAVKNINKQLETADKKISETLNDEMSYAAETALKESAKNLFKGLKDILGGFKDVSGANPFGTVDMINGVFGIGSSLGSMINLGGYACCDFFNDLFDRDLSDSLDRKTTFIIDAQESSDNEGLKDVFEDEGWDTLADMMELVDIGKSCFDISESLDELLEGDLKVLDLDFGFDFEFTGKYVDDMNKTLSNVKNALDYVELFVDPSDAGKLLVEKQSELFKKTTGTIKSVIDTFNDTLDFVKIL